MKLKLSVLLAVYASAVGAIFSPRIKSQQFEGSPDIVYFEDSADIVYLDQGSGSLYYSSNAGEDFNAVEIEGVKIKYLVQHPHKSGHAYAFSDDRTHFKTVSNGKTWVKFTTDVAPSTDSVETLESYHSPIVFHGERAEYALFAGPCSNGQSQSCKRQYYYTENNFDELKPLTEAYSCLFSQATPNIKADSKLVSCIIDGGIYNSVLARSNDWFATQTYATYKGGIMTDLKKLGAGSHSLIAISSQLGDSGVNVYSSYDGYNWAKIEFPSGTDLSGEFSVVEGTENSLFVDVKHSGSDVVGQLFFSTGVNGSFFTQSLDYTNRDANGIVDYELVQNIDGIVLANTVANGKDIISGSSASSTVVSKISFDQGLTWNNLKADGEKLHLHSLVHRAKFNPNAPGKYYSSPVPGVLLAVGNTGDSLRPYEEGDTFISTDAGLTWSKTLNGAYLFEFGDQGSVIVAVEDGADTSTIKYSTNFGKSWQQAGLDSPIRVKLLTTTPDSTNFKFLISGQTSDKKFKTSFVDFSGLYGRQCSSDDYENWFVKGLGSSEPLCILGHKQQFNRRAADADCFVGREYEEAIAIEEVCPCSQADFVCDLNYERDSSNNCVPAIASLKSEAFQEKLCGKGADSYEEPSGYTLRPGSVCSTSSGINLAKPIEKKCPTSKNSEDVNSRADSNGLPDETEPDTNPDEREGDKQKSKDGKNDGRVKTQSFAFGGKISKYVYLDRVPGSTLKDETIVLLTSHHKAYVTHDQGSTWELIAPEEEILDVYVNPYNANHVYLLSTNQKIIYSTDRADNWKSFRTPANYIPGVIPLRFHPKHSNWFIYIGQMGCDSSAHQGSCRTITYSTKSYGKRFAPLQENVKHCEFIGNLQQETSENLIVCQREDNSNTVHSNELLFSEDYFKSTQTPLSNVIAFVQAGDFLVAATGEADNTLRAHVSTNGKDWADALFPSNYHIDKQQAYTVLSAESKAIFLHVTTNQRSGSEYGAILKSNSNGTSYVLSHQYVNRDENGYVDFEQLENLEGVAVINVVSNPEDARGGAKKQLKTKITHNDGADWDFLQPPGKDSNDNKYECSGRSLKDCSLHLHGYTERADYRDTFSSGSAIGMMVAVGNVGSKLGPYLDGDTFLTRDGGVTWKEVKKGVYQWEYGDQGSIIVLVNGEDSTNTISYSLDEGITWEDYQFTEDRVSVMDISTVPSDDSRTFMLFTKLPMSKGDYSTVYQIDFSQLLKRKCNLDLQHPDTDDFDLWTPKHPHQSDNCLFGHEDQYYRKIPGKDCYIGEKLDKPYQKIRDCACTRQDYECDFNYYRDNNGECRLVPGYSPPDHSAVCKEFGVDEYWLPTGYRKIPLSTCQGGHEFDKVEAKPCAGKEAEFKRKHKGLTGFSLFVVVLIPLLGGAITVFVIYNHYAARYGQIKLGDDDIEFDESNLVNKTSSMIGFAVVTGVNLFAGIFESIGDVFRTLKNKITGGPISLDGNAQFSSSSAAYSDLPEDYRSPSPELVDGDDDILDEGDLTEVEDDRL